MRIIEKERKIDIMIKLQIINDIIEQKNLPLKCMRKSRLKDLIKDLMHGCASYIVGFRIPKQSDGYVLIIRADNIGDFLLFSPLLNPLKEFYSDKKIVFVGNASVQDLIPYYASIDEFIPVSVVRFRRNFLYRLRFLWALRARTFDAVIVPSFSIHEVADHIAKETSSPKKIAFGNDTRGIYTDTINPSPTISIELDRNIDFGNKLGLHIKETAPLFTLQEKDITIAIQLLKEYKVSDPFIILVPSAVWAGRSWPQEKYVEVTRWLHMQGYFVVLVGANSKKDLENAMQIEKSLSFLIANMTSKTTLPVLGALLKKSRLCIGNDTGPLHLAVAVGIPIVCIVGGGHFRRSFPYGNLQKNKIVFHPRLNELNCIGCNWTCACCRPPDGGIPLCVRDIPANLVIKGIQNSLSLSK